MTQSAFPTLAADEISTPVMIYLLNGMCWGDLDVRKPFNACSWLRSNTITDSLSLFNAKYVRLLMIKNPEPIQCVQLVLPMDQILAFHILPPAQDKLDYDPSEPNLRFELVNAISGIYQFSGKIRLPLNATLAKYLRDSREQYISLYDATVNCPTISKSGEIRSPFILVRKQSSVFLDIQKPSQEATTNERESSNHPL